MAASRTLDTAAWFSVTSQDRTRFITNYRSIIERMRHSINLASCRSPPSIQTAASLSSILSRAIDRRSAPILCATRTRLSCRTLLSSRLTEKSQWRAYQLSQLLAAAIVTNSARSATRRPSASERVRRAARLPAAARRRPRAGTSRQCLRVAVAATPFSNSGDSTSPR